MNKKAIKFFFLLTYIIALIAILCRLFSLPLPERSELIKDFALKLGASGLLCSPAIFFIYGENKIWKLLCAIIGYCGLFLFLVAAVLLVAEPIVEQFLYVCCLILNRLPVFSFITFSILAITVFSTFLLLIQIRFTNWVTNIALLRVYTLALAYGSIIFLLILLSIGVFYSIYCKDVFHLFGPYYVTNTVNVLFLFVFLICIVAVIYIFRALSKDLRVLVYHRDSYILFLRSFTFDSYEHEIYPVLNKVLFHIPHLHILKIGNPKTFWPKGIGECFYLPSKNWQKHLDYYIERAQFVFSVVDNTEGVLWEMFNHIKHYPKFIFYISDINKLRNIVNTNTSQEVEEHVLMKCFRELLNKDSIKRGAFFLYNNQCYYSNDSEYIVECRMNNKLKGLQSFTAEYVIDEVISKESPDVSYYDFLRNVIKKLSAYKNFFFNILDLFAMFLAIVFVLLSIVGIPYFIYSTICFIVQDVHLCAENMQQLSDALHNGNLSSWNQYNLHIHEWMCRVVIIVIWISSWFFVKEVISEE